jgi:hypothetical protein
MAYRATKSFTGLVSMVKGEVRELEDEKIVKDLLKSGYIEDLSEKQRAAKSSKPSKTKGGEE